MTIQRRLVYETLLSRVDHPTADEMYRAVVVKIPNISRTTVYRVLETLVDLGLAQRIQHQGSALRYDPVTARHHHLVCSDCGRVMDLEDEALNQLHVPQVANFKIQDYSIYFSGLCAACVHGAKRRS